jgi:hypothetical protein
MEPNEPAPPDEDEDADLSRMNEYESRLLERAKKMSRDVESRLRRVLGDEPETKTDTDEVKDPPPS